MRCEKSSQRPNHIGHYEIKKKSTHDLSIKGSHWNILNDEVTGSSMSKIFGIKSLNLKID